MWISPRIIHEVIHNGSTARSRYTALRAHERWFFHVSTGIHSRTGGLAPMIMNSRPQCVKDGDSCGYPPELCTGARRRFFVHGLSRCYAPLIHELSTTLWITIGPDESMGRRRETVGATDRFLRTNDPRHDDRELLRLGKRVETIGAEGCDGGRQQGRQPIAGPQPSHRQEGAEDANEGVDEPKN